MTDKVQKIRNEVERLQNELIQEREKGYSSDVDDACILELQNVLTFIDSLQEEPVSEDLGEYLYELSKQFPEVSFAKLSRIGVRVAKWQRKEIYEWLRTHKDEYVYNSPYDFFDIEQCIIDLKQAMKDE